MLAPRIKRGYHPTQDTQFTQQTQLTQLSKNKDESGRCVSCVLLRSSRRVALGGSLA